MPLIRLARPADLPALVAMVNALAEFHGDPPNADISALERDLFGDPIALCLVVEDAQLSGYVALTHVVQWQAGARGMDMHHLFVDAARRRTGLGAKLVSTALAQARDRRCAYVTVSTHPQNHAAQRFYLSQGFLPRAENPNRFLIRL